MCDGEKVRHAWIYGGMCEIRPPVYSLSSRRRHPAAVRGDRTGVANHHGTKSGGGTRPEESAELASRQNGSGPERDGGAIFVRV